MSSEGDLEAITGQSARGEAVRRKAGSGRCPRVDPAAAARVDEGPRLHDCPTERLQSRDGVRSLAAHGSGVHSQSVREEVEKLLLAPRKAPTPPGAEVSIGASTDAKAVSEVMGSAPAFPGGGGRGSSRLTKSANVTGTVWKGCAAAPSNEAARFANGLELREVPTPALGSHGELGLRGPRAARRGES